MRALIALLFFTSAAFAEVIELAPMRTAIAKSLPLLEAGARGSMEKRARCFTCHNQALPIMALSLARDRGFSIDAENLRAQVQFTADFLARNRTNYLAGKGQGGQADTAGFALWALAGAAWPADETTAAVAEYLLVWQQDSPHWRPQSQRPPTEASLFTSTHVALRALKTYGTPEQRERIEQRVKRAGEWLRSTPALDTEDRVARLYALRVIGEEASEAARGLLSTQRADGGWAQRDGMGSDAYATATALVALHRAGRLATSDAAYQRGLRHLLDAQLPDGSWHVRTRSKPIQTFYESGYPHGEDQFISITAAGWATIALTLALPER